MKLLCASDSFKGSLTSSHIQILCKQAAKAVFPRCEMSGISVADGGEGTAAAVVQRTGGTFENCCVNGPLMEPVKAVYGVFNGTCALIETAAASGLPLVPEPLRNPLHTTTYGTGELIRDALEKGYRKLFITLGGSATNDGGMGALRALGARFFDADGQELAGTGADLERVVAVDTAALHPALAEAEIKVLCDVTNPLTGECGAAHTFGKQKGGSLEVLDRLEYGMRRYARVLYRTTGIDAEAMAGAGAAGGLGAALHVFLRAELLPGIDTVLDLIGFDRCLDGVDLVVTGEGCADRQSIYGKVPIGIGKRCKARGIPVVMIAGSIGEGAEALYDYGIESIMPLVNAPMCLPEALNRAEELYIEAAIRLFRLVKTGMQLHGRAF